MNQGEVSIYEVPSGPMNSPVPTKRFPCHLPEIHVLSELTLPSATIRLTQYRLPARAQIDVVESDLTLYWRLRPLSVKMTGAVSSGPLTRFGRMMLHQPDTRCRAIAGEDPEAPVSLDCHFNRQWLASHIPPGPLAPADSVLSSLDFRHEGIEFLLRRVAHELLRLEAGSDVLLDSLMTAAGIDLSRHLQHCRDVASPISEIQRLIRSSAEVMSVAQLAEHCGISQSHLRRIVHARTGRRVSDLIEDERISRARRLLRDTTMPLKVISHRIGYSQQSGFSNAFKNRCGISPMQFRKQVAGTARFS